MRSSPVLQASLSQTAAQASHNPGVDASAHAGRIPRPRLPDRPDVLLQATGASSRFSPEARGLDLPETNAVLRTIGQRLRAGRTGLGFTQAQVAALSFLRIPAVSEFELGKRAPTIPVLLRLADAVDVTVEDLLHDLTPPCRRVSTAQLLVIVARQPGITTHDLTNALDMPRSYVLQLLRRLRQTGELIGGPSWHIGLERAK